MSDKPIHVDLEDGALADEVHIYWRDPEKDPTDLTDVGVSVQRGALLIGDTLGGRARVRVIPLDTVDEALLLISAGDS